MTLKKNTLMELEKGSTRSHCV